MHTYTSSLMHTQTHSLTYWISFSLQWVSLHPRTSSTHTDWILTTAFSPNCLRRNIRLPILSPGAIVNKQAQTQIPRDLILDCPYLRIPSKSSVRGKSRPQPCFSFIRWQNSTWGTRELARVPSLSNMIALSQQGFRSIKARERKKDARAELHMRSFRACCSSVVVQHERPGSKMVLSSHSKNRRMRCACVET